MRDLGDHPVAVAQQLDSALDPPFQDKLVWRLADRDLECLDKMVGAQPGNSGEFGEPEIVLEVRVNVIKDTPHLSRSEPASVRNRRTLRRAVAAQQMHGQHGSQSLQIKPSPGTTFTQFAPSERAEARDHRVLDTDRGSDREVFCLIEGFLRDLSDKGFIERKSEEGRRGIIADPKWEPGVANMNVAVRDGDRLGAVTFGRAPAHFKRFALVYCYDYLRGGEVFAFDGARSAVNERDWSNTQMFVECEPPGWLARCKVDQVVPQMLAPDRSHRSLPPTGEIPNSWPVAPYSQTLDVPALYSLFTIEYAEIIYYYTSSKLV
jgi:hypothetical protein